MSSWGSGPLTLLGLAVLVGGLLLALRWTFGTSRTLPVPHVTDPADPTGDGLLAEVALLPTEAAAEVLRDRLAGAGIRATISRAEPGYRLLVFTDDEPRALLVLRE